MIVGEENAQKKPVNAQSRRDKTAVRLFRLAYFPCSHILKLDLSKHDQCFDIGLFQLSGHKPYFHASYTQAGI